jgi:hypothetical protein
MNAVETICRQLAGIACKAKDEDWNDDRAAWFVQNHWTDYEHEAKRILRSLKGQPPHVTDAGNELGCNCTECRSQVLDAMLEAMTR